MKIFNMENGNEVGYVQMQDLAYLHESNIQIPKSIFERVYSPGTNIAKDLNKFYFLRFSKKEDIEFFKNVDFIVEYEKYKNLTEVQLQKECEKINQISQQKNEEWNMLTEKEKATDSTLYYEILQLEHMKKAIGQICEVKYKGIEMPFPTFVEVIRV